MITDFSFADAFLGDTPTHTLKGCLQLGLTGPLLWHFLTRDPLNFSTKCLLCHSSATFRGLLLRQKNVEDLMHYSFLVLSFLDNY